MGRRRALGQQLSQRGRGIGAQHRSDAAREDRDRECNLLHSRQCCRIRAAQQVDLSLLYIVESTVECNPHPLHGKRGYPKLDLDLTADYLRET